MTAPTEPPSFTISGLLVENVLSINSCVICLFGFTFFISKINGAVSDAFLEKRHPLPQKVLAWSKTLTMMALLPLVELR